MSSPPAQPWIVKNKLVEVEDHYCCWNSNTFTDIMIQRLVDASLDNHLQHEFHSFEADQLLGTHQSKVLRHAGVSNPRICP